MKIEVGFEVRKSSDLDDSTSDGVCQRVPLHCNATNSHSMVLNILRLYINRIVVCEPCLGIVKTRTFSPN